MGVDPATTPPADGVNLTAAVAAGEGALGSYGRALRSHPWLVALIFLVIFGAGVAWSVVRTRSYQATARLLINPLPQTDSTFLGLPLLRDSGDPTTNMETASTLIDTPQAAQATAQQIGGGWTQHRVQAAVNVQPDGPSDIVDVIATASSPQLAARLANTFTNAALAARSAQLRAAVGQDIKAITGQLASIAPGSPAAANLETQLSSLRPLAAGQDPTISISQAATIPVAASGLSRPEVVAIALLVAIVIASALALLLELLRSPRVLTEEQLLALLPAPVLARIPVLPRRLRRGDALRRPLPAAVSEALRSTRIQLDLLRGQHRTIMITSAFHGDGKTTTTVNLAREIAASGAEVIIVDIDLRKPDIGRSFGITPSIDLPSALEDDEEHLGWLKPAPGIPGVRVLAADPDAEFSTLDRVARSLGQFLEDALQTADYVLLDAPPLGEVTDVLRFVDLVDDILLVSRLGNTTVGTMQVTSELLARARRMPTGHLIIGATPRTVQGYGYGYGYASSTGAAARVGEDTGRGPGTPEPLEATGAEPRRGRR